MAGQKDTLGLFERFAFWRSRSHRTSADQEVIIHDPAAAGPKDLDDPFDDATVQQRVGSVIAQSKKPLKPDDV